MLKIIIKISLTLLLFSQAACTTISLKESHFIKPDKRIQLSDLKAINRSAKTQLITIASQDGIQLRGTLITIDNAKATILYFGGNQFRVNIAGGEPATALLPLQTNILMIDHRGYGLSDGKPTIDNLKQDALTVFDFAKQHSELVNAPIIVHGHSLGSMIASYVASQRSVAALVLEGSVTNVEQMTQSRIPWYAKPFIELNYSPELRKIDNLKVMEQYTAPLLIITGEKDTQTPSSLAKDLYAHSASKHKQLYIAQGKHHGDALDGAELKKHYEVLLAQLTPNSL
ncbi:alpha/beta hydrolase [Pseudoalteromonas porphyrae]|uniref:Alpha/beta hydrolase n=2 Tax=Pseudoalteromonas TaxID=53246 RepID=A0A0N1ENV8_9GAMM|nr:alpha/beta fold hydrolase [Pseudoalteromonas porphyrae]KPH64570.1 alpha/beta hydrolase [Pseudoalteromonas porphyrae]KPH94338.1 alpha/beta hydrolase [Pseudoalteromonas porphyrae]